MNLITIKNISTGDEITIGDEVWSAYEKIGKWQSTSVTNMTIGETYKIQEVSDDEIRKEIESVLVGMQAGTLTA